MEEAKNPIKSVQIAVLILETLKSFNGATLLELNEVLDISKSAIYNHLATLEEAGFVIQNGREYNLGLYFLVLGRYTRDNNILYSIGQEEVRRLADITGECSHLTVEQNGLGIKLYKEYGNKAIGEKYQHSKLRKREHLHHTATGKAILAHQSDKKVQAIIDTYGLPSKTSNTITDETALFTELDAIRENGYAFNDEEEVDGIQAIGAPIIVNENNVLGAISVSAPTTRFNRSTLTENVIESSNIIATNINMSLEI